jgi:hypothetical protein
VFLQSRLKSQKSKVERKFFFVFACRSWFHHTCKIFSPSQNPIVQLFSKRSQETRPPRLFLTSRVNVDFDWLPLSCSSLAGYCLSLSLAIASSDSHILWTLLLSHLRHSLVWASHPHWTHGLWWAFIQDGRDCGPCCVQRAIPGPGMRSLCSANS